MEKFDGVDPNPSDGDVWFGTDHDGSGVFAYVNGQWVDGRGYIWTSGDPSSLYFNWWPVIQGGKFVPEIKHV